MRSHISFIFGMDENIILFKGRDGGMFLLFYFNFGWGSHMLYMHNPVNLDES